MRIWLYLYQATAFGNETVAAMILLVAPTHQRTALHRDRHRAGWIQRRERVDRAGYLAAARHSFAVRVGLWRLGNDARPVGPEELHLQSSGADALRPDDRLGKARLLVLAQRLNAIQPDGSDGARELQIQTPARFGLSTQPEDDGPLTLVATLLMAMAGAVLLIACLNLTNMLLARGTSRSKEIAVRLAAGASRWQIVRQLLCEGFLLAVFGGVIGLILSAWCNDALLQQLRGLLASVNFSFVAKLRPDTTVLEITFLFCLIATMLFSLGPALTPTNADPAQDLKEQVGEPARIGRLSRFFAPRHISVMAQIALSLMLLFAAGLFFRGALKAAGLNPGFVASGDIISEFDFTLIKKTPADSRRLIFDMVRRIRELPGVTASATGTMLPYSDFTSARRVLRTRDTMPNDPKAPDPSVNSLFTAITPGYCEAMGIKLLRGR